MSLQLEPMPLWRRRWSLMQSVSATGGFRVHLHIYYRSLPKDSLTASRMSSLRHRLLNIVSYHLHVERCLVEIDNRRAYPAGFLVQSKYTKPNACVALASVGRRVSHLCMQK